MRLAITGAVAAAFFLLGSAYLSLGRPGDVTTFLVAGGPVVRAGSSAALRVSARRVDAREHQVATVTGLRLGGVDTAYDVDGDRPAIVRFHVPADVGAFAELEIDASSEGGSEVLDLRIPARHVSPSPPLAAADVRPLHRVATPHRVQVRPEAGVLASNMDNRVFVRVLAGSGAPLEGAQVTITHPTLSDGKLERVTDETGLVELRIQADQPSFRLGVVVEAQGQVTRTDALLHPLGRRMLLHLDRGVVSPGERVAPRLVTWRDQLEVTCDLIAEEAWIWSGRLRSANGRATLDLGPLPTGRYDLQCSEHPLVPGESFATLPIVVDERSAHDVLVEMVRAEERAHPASLVPSAGARPDRAVRFWQSLLRRTVVAPVVLANSRGSALAERTRVHEKKKGRLLWAMACLFLVIMLWVADAILHHVLTNRERMGRFAAEVLIEAAGDSLDPAGLLDASRDRDALMRTRGTLLLVVVGGAVILNVLGVLALLAMIR